MVPELTRGSVSGKVSDKERPSVEAEREGDPSLTPSDVWTLTDRPATLAG